MLPGYGYMNLFPQQGNQMPHMQYHQPNTEAVPSQAMMDPSKCSNNYGFYPYGGYHAYPALWHTCCNHNGFPGYVGYPSPCHHPLSPYPSCGNYSFFPQGYPVQYFTPTYYTMELPRYEYDKTLPKECHCCGCPHHKSSQRQEHSLKNGEEEPDSGSGGSESLVPKQPTDFPNSVMWIPGRNSHCRMPVDELKVAQEDINSGKGKNPEKYAGEPKELKGWYPFDLDSLKSSMNGGEATRSQAHRNEKSRQLPFPILWMPSFGDQEIAQKGPGMVEPECSAVVASDSFFTPEDLSSNSVQPSGNRINRTEDSSTDGSADNFKPNKENSSSSLSSNATNKTLTLKDIPVKGVEADKHDTAQENATAQRRGEKLLVEPSSKEKHDKDTTDNQSKDLASKFPEKATKRQSKSPPKSPPKSKLPPVCLRVDPLPKKKANNGSPRPPSDHKGGSNGKSETLSASVLEVGSPESSESGPVAKSMEKAPERVRKTIQVMEIIPNPEEKSDLSNIKETGTCNDQGNSEDVGISTSSGVMDSETKTVAEMTELAGSVQKSCEKRLSEEQAAVLIQSAYRGFEVRRWEPLQKLKQIVKIHGQTEEVKKQIEALAASSDPQKSDKQELATGETIMRLLLELDRIQGLHPSLRDIRKSLARELVTLQEKLDSIMLNKNKTEPDQGLSNAKAAETDSANVEIASCELNEAARVELEGNGKLKDVGGNGVGDTGEKSDQTILKGRNDADVSNALDSAVASQGEVAFGQEELYSLSNTDPMQEQATCDNEHKLAQPAAVVEANDMQAAKQFGVHEHVTEAAQEKAEKNSENQHQVEFSLDEDIKSGTQLESSEHPSGQVNSDPLQKEEVYLPNNIEPALLNMLEELPVGVLDDDVTYDLNEDVQTVAKPPEINDCGAENDEFSSGEAFLVTGSEERIGSKSSNRIGMNMEVPKGETVVVPEKAEKQEKPDNLEKCRQVELQGKEVASMEGKLETKEEEPGVNGSADCFAVALEQDSNESAKKETKVAGEFNFLPSEQTGVKKNSTTEVTQGEQEMERDKTRKLAEENDKLKEAMEKLLESGRSQLDVISHLTGRVKELEIKLAKRRNVKSRRAKGAQCGSSRRRLNAGVDGIKRVVDVAM